MVDISPRSAVRSAYICIMGQMSDNTICLKTSSQRAEGVTSLTQILATYLIERLGSLLSRDGRIHATFANCIICYDPDVGFCPIHQHGIDLSPLVPSVTNNIHGVYYKLQTLMDYRFSPVGMV